MTVTLKMPRGTSQMACYKINKPRITIKGGAVTIEDWQKRRMVFSLSERASVHYFGIRDITVSVFESCIVRVNGVQVYSAAELYRVMGEVFATELGIS